MGLVTVIGTAPGREAWLAQCLVSIGIRDIQVISLNDGYELGKIHWVLNNTIHDRFLFLQDSCEIKNSTFWSLLDEYQYSVALMNDPFLYGCYMGIYERRILEQLDFWPEINSKADSIRFEIEWTRAYCDKAGEVPVLFPDLHDSMGVKRERFGRDNLVLENEYFAKWKGTWT